MKLQIPGTSELSTLYKGTNGKRYQESVHAVSTEEYDLVANNRRRKLQPFVNAHHRVLEYGMGTGWNLAKLQAVEKVGFDIFIDEQIPFSERSINVVTHEDQIPLGYFDRVICHHVLEHLPNPCQVLLTLQHFLKPDGQLLLHVPYERRRWYSRWHPTDVNHHIYSWNVQSFCNLVNSIGMEIISYRILRTGYDRYAARLVKRFRLPIKSYSLVINILRFIRPDHEIEVIAKLIAR